jgi:hypothetical protein
MYVLQSAIIFAVMASYIHWQWAPNPYVAAIYAVATAFGVTAAVNWVAHLVG